MVTIAEDSNGFATVTVRVDGIALEPDETFQLRLEPNPQQNPLPDVSRIFCLDTLDFIIEDGNGISIKSIMCEDYYYDHTRLSALCT